MNASRTFLPASAEPPGPVPGTDAAPRTARARNAATTGAARAASEGPVAPVPLGTGLPPSAAAVLRMQRVIGNAAVASVLDAARREAVQRKIVWDGFSFDTDGERPGWRKFLKASVAREYNDIFHTGYSAGSELPDTDRAHRMPFAAIEQLVADYCDDEADEGELEALTNALYDGKGSPEERGMIAARDRLIVEANRSHPDQEKVAWLANKLLSWLNSATLNVSPGDASTNRGIQDNADWGMAYTPGGVHAERTPRSEQIYSAWEGYGRAPDPTYTPGGGVRSSHHHSYR